MARTRQSMLKAYNEAISLFEEAKTLVASNPEQAYTKCHTAMSKLMFGVRKSNRFVNMDDIVSQIIGFAQENFSDRQQKLILGIKPFVPYNNPTSTPPQDKKRSRERENVEELITQWKRAGIVTSSSETELIEAHTEPAHDVKDNSPNP